MRNYIVMDDYSDHTEKLDYKGLIELLLEELERDTFENHENRDIVNNNLKVYRKLVLEDYIDMKYLNEQLNSYGWTILNLHELQKGLATFQSFKHGIGSPCIPRDCIDETLDMIDKEMR